MRTGIAILFCLLAFTSCRKASVEYEIFTINGHALVCSNRRAIPNATILLIGHRPNTLGGFFSNGKEFPLGSVTADANGAFSFSVPKNDEIKTYTLSVTGTGCFPYSLDIAKDSLLAGKASDIRLMITQTAYLRISFSNVLVPDPDDRMYMSLFSDNNCGSGWSPIELITKPSTPGTGESQGVITDGYALYETNADDSTEILVGKHNPGINNNQLTVRRYDVYCPAGSDTTRIAVQY